jgi:hypothetical protein
MWTYKQANGQILWDDRPFGFGYSGHGTGKNNPAMEAAHDVGPIPRGDWTIGDPGDTLSHGPFVLPLMPCDGTDTLGRGGFLIHGDAASHLGEASRGCIILPRWARERIAESGDRLLRVI